MSGSLPYPVSLAGRANPPGSLPKRGTAGGRLASGGFTLIEMMIVIAIVALVLSIGIPSMFSSMNKEGMRKATSDLLEACAAARAAAIISGRTAELVFRPGDKTFIVSGGGVSQETGQTGSQIEAPTFSGRLPDGVDFAGLLLYGDEVTEEEEFRVKFYANGTSDQFGAVITSGPEVRSITLEVITGTADLEVVR
jgi:prepilin-type N-terminal cleavage/methylation domain-containing protein